VPVVKSAPVAKGIGGMTDLPQAGKYSLHHWLTLL